MWSAATKCYSALSIGDPGKVWGPLALDFPLYIGQMLGEIRFTGQSRGDLADVGVPFVLPPPLQNFGAHERLNTLLSLDDLGHHSKSPFILHWCPSRSSSLS